MCTMERTRLRNTARHLITTKFSTGETSSLERVGIYGKSDEYLNIVDRFDDKLLLQLNQELQKSPNNDPPNAYLRAAVLRARFSKPIGGGAVDQSQPSAKRGRWEEKKKELHKIEEQRRKKLEQQRVADEMRAEVMKKVKEVEDNAEVALKDLCWPEDNFRVMMEFEQLINGGATGNRRHQKSLV